MNDKPKTNHFDPDGNLIIEKRTMFRQVGWVGHNGKLYPLNISDKVLKIMSPGGFSPIYKEIAVDNGEGWED